MTTPQEKTQTFNRLLAEELAVVAAYEQAEADLAGDPQAEDLRKPAARRPPSGDAVPSPHCACWRRCSSAAC
jgi:hypothetical protein